jgi:hypothetical protein
MRIIARGGERSAAARAPRSARAKPRDIVAKDLIVSRILLSLYFTIFLNQLDNLFPYTENGTIRPDSGVDWRQLLMAWLRRL